MDRRNAIALLGRPIAYYPKLNSTIQNANACILLCQLIYWSDKTSNPDGWIYKTASDITEETGLTYREQQCARKRLVELGLIEENYRRLDHRMDFRAMNDAIVTLLEALDSKRMAALGGNGGVPQVVDSTPTDKTSFGETTKRQFGKERNVSSGNDETSDRYKEHRVLTEITSEITNKSLPVSGDTSGSTKQSIELIQRQWFEEFWRYYPRKDDKTPCWERFKVHIRSQERFDKTMEALSLVLPEWATKERQFIPYPKSWLGKKPWNDVESIRASRGSVAMAQPQQANTARPSMQERTHAAFVRQIQRMQEIQNGQMG